jgi:hypothetical protein
MKKLFFILLILFTSRIYCQSIISGSVYNSKNNEILPFANIVVNGKIGLTTDKKGKYEIKTENINYSDSVYISYLGYKTYKTIIKTLLKIDTVRLEAISFNIKEVSINPEIYDIPISYIGPQNLNKDKYISSLNFVKIEYLPHTELIYLKPRKKGKIENIKIYLTKRGEYNTKFRVHLYDVRSDNGKPNKELLTENIFVSSKKGNEWIEINLTDYNIIVDTIGFYVGTEIFYTTTKNTYSRRKEGEKIKYHGAEIKRVCSFEKNYKTYIKSNMYNKDKWMENKWLISKSKNLSCFPIIIAGIKYL